MPLYQLSLRFAAVLLLLFCGRTQPALGETGDPLAIRHLPEGAVRIESHWGLTLVVSPAGAAEMTQVAENGTVKQVTIGAEVDHVLSRPANASQASWSAGSDRSGLPTDPNGIRVKSIGNHAFWVRLDGAELLVAGRGFEFDDSSQLPEDDRSYDAVVLNAAAVEALDVKQVSVWVQKNRPRILVLASPASATLANSLSRSIRVSSSIKIVAHNTLAVSQSESQSNSVSESNSVQIVCLGVSPIELSQELESLMVKMEKSCGRSQQVFASLSARQLNFKPANGTHTPRWNAEHMMGRQLLFFSQIYHELSPEIPVIDRNPKQMPPDYRAAHPDWDGAEEARQMQRVSDFTRRFSYLLRDIDLDSGAPGSRWTLRGLLRQMERHYDDHTGNTEKKFSLPGWPKD